MVTRKPLHQDGGLGTPPYPITPIDTNTQPQFRMQDARNALHSASDSDSPNAWTEEGIKGQPGRNDVPESLRVGPPGYSQHSSQELLRPDTTTTNPYLQKQSRNGVNEHKDSSAAAWGGFAERPSHPSEPPPPPPISKGTYSIRSRNEDMLISLGTPPPDLSTSESNTNPWQPALDSKAPIKPTHIPTLHTEDSGNTAWSTPAPSSTLPDHPVLIDIEDEGNESPAWDEDSIPSPTVQELPADNTRESRQILEDQHAWD